VKKNDSKTRFWLILLTVNVLACLYPVGLLLGSDDDATRLLGIIVLMGALLLLTIADTLSIVFAYWV
jgi:hypothetical protein